MKEQNIYPFYWLDEIVEVTLNPVRTNLNNLSPEILNIIRDRLPAEIATITTRLKTQAFCIYSSEHIKVITGQYDQSVRLLQKQAAANVIAYPRCGILRQVGELIVAALAELSQSIYSRYPAFLPDPAPLAETEPSPQTNIFSKILCALSADQLGIILRAATDTGVLLGRSFRMVCKAMAPYLSTPWKKDIKADTFRSHATRPENRDKEIVIAFLEKMIAKIKGYR